MLPNYALERSSIGVMPNYGDGIGSLLGAEQRPLGPAQRER